MAQRYKYYIVHLVKHGRSLFDQDAKAEAESQKEMNKFIRSWHPKIEQVMALHCMGLAGEWDWIGIFGSDELADWVGFREALTRQFPGHIDKFLSLPAISHDAFVEATDAVDHYKELRAIGVYPGGAEFREDERG